MGGKQYHTECIKCATCLTSLRGKGVTAGPNGEFLCQNCYQVPCTTCIYCLHHLPVCLHHLSALYASCIACLSACTVCLVYPQSSAARLVPPPVGCHRPSAQTRFHVHTFGRDSDGYLGEAETVELLRRYGRLTVLFLLIPALRAADFLSCGTVFCQP